MPSRITFLFADDKELFRKAVLDSIKDQDKIICVGEAGNGAELLKLLKTKQAQVILLDLEMPVMDGNEAMSRIMKMYPDSKILILSYHYEAELVEDYLVRGARGYLCKDALSGNVQLLVEAIEKIHAGEVFVHHLPVLTKNNFTRHQIELIPLMCEDMTNKEIAEHLGIHQRSVEKRKQKLFSKTNTESSTSFLKFAIKKGFDFLERKIK